MAIHLQEIMEDGETFGRSVVRAYHGAWLQQLEQGRATWEDGPTRLKLRRPLVWHRVAPLQPREQPTATNPAQGCTGPVSDTSKNEAEEV